MTSKVLFLLNIPRFKTHSCPGQWMSTTNCSVALSIFLQLRVFRKRSFNYVIDCTVPSMVCQAEIRTNASHTLHNVPFKKAVITRISRAS